MQKWEESYKKWRSFKNLDISLKQELEKMDESALKDAFHTELTFGTGGIRGMLGPGINRMNIYTVRKAVNGLAKYLLISCVNVRDRGVVVAYDSRHMSKEFAIETAKVLGAYGIRAHVFDTLQPTPLLSYAVRYLGTVAGIMVTASHYPPEYNGMKVYNEDGGQIVPKEANAIVEKIKEMDDELAIPVMEQSELEEKGLLTWIGNEIENAYLEQLAQTTKFDPDRIKADKNLEIVFTPLHGTSQNLVMRGLKQLNFNHVSIVEEQATSDPEFSTVSSPNPEEHKAFRLAMELGKEKNADILLATDPDSDRLGVAVKNSVGGYTVLTGNQLGSLFIDYILSHTDPILLKNARVLKTIVTTEMGRAIAESYGVQTVDTLTGFKYIAEKIHQYDGTGETFLFGFEESYGYLISSFVRDKDAVQAAVMACEMAYYWKNQGKTLLEALNRLKEKHGFYLEGMSSLTFKEVNGLRQIANIMETIRNKPLMEIGGLSVEQVEDYQISERIGVYDGRNEAIELPKENVLKFILANNSWVCLRPSGTEPKIKCYFGVCQQNEEASEKTLAALKAEMEELMQKIIKYEEFQKNS